MKNIIDKIKGFFGKVKEFFVKCVNFCKEKLSKVSWKDVWDKTTTVLLVLVLASPLFILAYIISWFFMQGL